MKPGNIQLHIDELVLHGFALADRYRIGAAVEAELVRLFGEQGVPSSLGNAWQATQVDGGAFEVMPGSGAEAIGGQVARAVYGGVSL